MNNRDIYYIWASENNRYNPIDKKEAKLIYKDALNKGFKVINIESDEYPDSLRCIEKPPLVLFCNGDVSLLKDDSVAIVGTRRASAYGKWVTEEIGKTLVKCGVTHVSGMAEGIDSAGHRSIIKAGGKSIAVLGTGVDTCFPRSSRDVFESITGKGLIVSEYPPGTTGYRANFPARNRIISGLASKVIIVEGALRSGSLITAKIALEQGKDIYAIPGNINQPNSIGPNILIQDGAIPIVNLTEIAETLGIGYLRQKRAEIQLTGLEKQIYEIVKDNGTLSIEDISGQLPASAEEILAKLTYLQLQGLLRIDGSLVNI